MRINASELKRKVYLRNLNKCFQSRCPNCKRLLRPSILFYSCDCSSSWFEDLNCENVRYEASLDDMEAFE